MCEKKSAHKSRNIVETGWMKKHRASKNLTHIYILCQRNIIEDIEKMGVLWR